MYLPREVEQRLLDELGPPRLHVRLDLFRERWCCFERHRRLGGARSIPVAILDDGRLIPGFTHFRVIHDYDDRVLVLEGANGEYQSLDPNLMVRELLLRDAFRFKHRDLAAHLLRQVEDRRERRRREDSDLFADLASENRRRFARVAAEMGI